MALNLDTLSLWEIAFRWHDLDPHRFARIEDIPLPVKDTIRLLAAEVHYEHLYSKLRLEREGIRITRPGWMFWKPELKLYVSDFSSEFRDCIHKNVIDPDFLKSVYIQFWELEYWCRERQIPVPSFWIRSQVFGGDKVPIGDRIYTLPPVEREGKEIADPVPEDDPEESPSGSNSQQQAAALARHEPVNELKRECVIYWLSHQNLSYADAARRFYAGLSPDKQRRLSKDNAETTFAKALSEYKNRNKKNSLPPWLVDFHPEPAQTI